MGISYSNIIDLRTTNAPDDGGNSTAIVHTTGAGGASTSTYGGNSGNAQLVTGPGGNTSAAGYYGGESGDIRLLVGDGGEGMSRGGHGGDIQIYAGDGGNAAASSNGDGGNGGTIRIEAGSKGNADGTGTDGTAGVIYLTSTNAIYIGVDGGTNTVAIGSQGGAGTTHVNICDSLSIGPTTHTQPTSVSLDLFHTDKAPLFPRMTTTQRDAMTAPLDGMIIYNTTNATHECRKGSAWVPIPSTGGGGGENNTASNAGSGTSLFYQKTVVDLEFNGIKSETARLTVALDAVSHDIELTVAEDDLIHDDVAGEFAGVTLKGSPAGSDLVLIEDSADSNNKKRATIGSLFTADKESQVFTVPSSVAVRDLVYVTGDLTADRADHTAVSTSKSIGVVIAKPTSTSAEVVFYGMISGYSGLTAGSQQFLGTTGGMIESSLPTTPGYVIKKVGMAISATVLLFNPKQGITL